MDGPISASVPSFKRGAKSSITGVETMVSRPAAAISTGTLMLAGKSNAAITAHDLNAARIQPIVGAPSASSGAASSTACART